jgi:hypothetical protein
MKFSKSQPIALAVILLFSLALPSLASQITQQINIPDGPRSASSCSHDWSANETIAPSKIVVEPWKGRHHVYAEFQLPAGKFVSDRAKVSLASVGEFCGGVTEGSTTEASMGQTTAIARLRTRTALWLMLQGKLDELKVAKNWQLPIAG